VEASAGLLQVARWSRAEHIGAHVISSDLPSGDTLNITAAINRDLSSLSPSTDRRATDTQLSGKRALCSEQAYKEVNDGRRGASGGLHADI